MGKWKAVQTDQNLALYDLSKDLGEAKDVAAKNPAVVDKAKKIIRELE